jgi:hypothetical protein
MGSANLQRLQQKRKYLDPDRLGNPEEELRKLVDSYQQISGAKAIGRHLNLDGNRSKSFSAFVSGMRRLLRASE